MVPYSELGGRRPARARACSSPGFTTVGWIVALGAAVSMTAVLLVFQYGQPRIFFAMARDGLLPAVGGEDPSEYAAFRYVTTLITGHRRRLARRSSATRPRPTT